MSDFQLDQSLVDEFVAGQLDPRREALLAAQVARLLPYRSTLPNPIASALSRVIGQVGGEAALLGWLARHPGEPRLVANLYGVIGLLDRCSDNPAVVAAFRQLREGTGDPPDLAPYLVPDTTEATLASLAASIEALLATYRADEASRVAAAAAAVLEQVVSRAAESEPALAETAGLAAQVRRDILAVIAEDPAILQTGP